MSTADVRQRVVDLEQAERIRRHTLTGMRGKAQQRAKEHLATIRAELCLVRARLEHSELLGRERL